MVANLENRRWDYDSNTDGAPKMKAFTETKEVFGYEWANLSAGSPELSYCMGWYWRLCEQDPDFYFVANRRKVDKDIFMMGWHDANGSGMLEE